MSVANKEQVCSHRLVPRLGEPAVGVPIKKRPVLLPERSVASGMPLSTKSLSSVPEVPVSAGEAFFNAKSDTDVIAKENESSTALVDESQNQKFLALDLQLASRGNGKNKYGSVVKEEKVDQGFSSFHSAQSHNNVQIASEINSGFGRLPNLDLNVPLDPVDSFEGSRRMHESGNGLHHRSIQHQNAQVLPAAPSGPSRSIDSTLKLSNSYGLSHKCGPADVTLDLQLKPPARPELGINWKGLAPAPELSLSLFGKPMDEPMALSAESAPNILFDSDPALSSKKVSEEVTKPGSDKSAAEAVTLALCKASAQNTSPSVNGTDKAVPNNIVKKEPEEPSTQHIINDVGRTHLLEQSVQLANHCAESEKVDSASQVRAKTGFDLNSDIFPDSSMHNGLDTVTDNVPITAQIVPKVVRTETMPAVPKVQKSVKHEGSTSATPSPEMATVTGQAAPLMAEKLLPLKSNVASHAIGSCESYSQPSASAVEPSCSDTVCKPPASHLNAHDDMLQRPCDANEAYDALQSSSKFIAEPLVHNSRDYAGTDGMSQGSAEMDCSDDDNNTVSLLPTNDRHQDESLGNGPTTEDGMDANNLCKELDSDTRQDCSPLTNKVSMEVVDGDKCVEIRDGSVSHAGEEGHQSEDLMKEESKDKQLLKSDKCSLLNKTDNSMHDVNTTTGSCPKSQRLSVLGAASLKMASNKQPPKNLDNCPMKTRSLDIKTERSSSPHGKLAASLSENHANIAAVKIERRTESEEVAGQSDLGLDGASSSQPDTKSMPEKSDDKSNLESCVASSVPKERDGQLVGSNWRDLGYAYVNRNERWEKFMKSEQEKNKGEYQDGRHGSDMTNQRRTDHRYGGRGVGSRGRSRNFRGPRMSNELPFEDDLEHFHRMPHRRRRSPPAGCLMREMESDGFPGREISDPRLLARGHIEDLPDDLIQERFFMPYSHRHHAQGDHGFIHRERSHSPAQRRGAPVHFHRGRSPEVHRSPPLMQDERSCLTHRRHTRRHGSPLDRIGHDERGMQRNARRCGMIGSHQALEEDALEQPLYPAHLAEIHAEEELVGRRKYRERRAYLRSLEEVPTHEEDMLSYHAEDNMEFADGGGPRELDGRFRNRVGHRARGEQEDGYRHRGPQGWRDVEDNRPKRRRY